MPADRRPRADEIDAGPAHGHGTFSLKKKRGRTRALHMWDDGGCGREGGRRHRNLPGTGWVWTRVASSSDYGADGAGHQPLDGALSDRVDVGTGTRPQGPCRCRGRVWREVSRGLSRNIRPARTGGAAVQGSSTRLGARDEKLCLPRMSRCAQARNQPAPASLSRGFRVAVC